MSATKNSFELFVAELISYCWNTPTSDAYTTALLRIRVTSQKCRKFNIWRKSAFAKRNGYAAASIKSKTLKASPLSNRRSERPAG